MKWRRTISMSPEAYLRLRTHCLDEGLAMAATVERLIREHLDGLGAPRITHAEAVERLRDEADVYRPTRPLTPRYAEEP